MKRVFSNDVMRSATASVANKLNDAKEALSDADASALSEMVKLASKNAQELSKDQLSIAQAGAALKPKSLVAF